MKTYYTEKAWHRAAVEDARNPSFTIMEIEFKAGDTLVIGDEEYSDVEYSTSVPSTTTETSTKVIPRTYSTA